ncbi:hypothetical protein [Effusibacillus consociatus]|uniref:Multidrug transporter n=1 Tax=Effusibacillus consociatus TaxID=1117041 RepID=A0ABV9Q5V7_9BACL
MRPESEETLIKADNPDDLEGAISESAQGDPDTLVEQDNPDDIEIPDPSLKH